MVDLRSATVPTGRRLGHAPGLDQPDAEVAARTRRIRDAGAAAPPHDAMPRRLERSTGCSSQQGSSIAPDRRHAADEVTRSCSISSSEVLGRHEAARVDLGGADHARRVNGRPQALAWNIGTTEQARRPRSLIASRSRLRPARSECRHDRAMAVDDALRVARRAGRVAHARPRAFSSSSRPGEGAGRSAAAAPRSAGRRAAARRHRHVAASTITCSTVSRWGRSFSSSGHERVVDEDDPVLGVVDDVDELLREEPDVHRVEHRAHAGHREVELEVPAGVPGEGGDPVARAHAQAGPAPPRAARPGRRPRRRSRGASPRLSW